MNNDLKFMMTEASGVAPLFLLCTVLLCGCYAPMVTAARQGDTQKIEQLLAQGADINDNNTHGSGLIPPLSWAAMNGKLAAVKLMVSRGADVNLVSSEGRTPLDYAVAHDEVAAYDEYEMTKFLLEHGADPHLGMIGQSSLSGQPVARMNPRTVAMLKGARKQSINTADINTLVEQAVKKSKKSDEDQAASIASDVDEPDFSRKENPNLVAVVVGIEKYPHLPPALFADRDAKTVRKYLFALGFAPRNVLFLSGADATRAGIVSALNSWLPKNVTADSTVLFYYSGHGAPDPESSDAYLVPMDGNPEDLPDTAYPVTSVYQNLTKLKTKHVLVALDSCFSGAGGRSVLAHGARPLVTKVKTGAATSGNIVTMSASSGDQISGSLDDQGHGAFTYYFLKGLGGGAADSGGAVTVESLYGYLKPKVQDEARLHNRGQTPQLINGPEAQTDWRLR